MSQGPARRSLAARRRWRPGPAFVTRCLTAHERDAPAGDVATWRNLPEALRLLRAALEPTPADEAPFPAPFSAWAAAEVACLAGDPALGSSVDWGRVGPSLVTACAAECQRAARRVLVLEVNVERLHGRLDGVSAEERFDSFVRRLSSEPSRLRRLLRRHAGLARLWAERCLAWRRAVRAFFEALAADREALPAWTGAGARGDLVLCARRAAPGTPRADDWLATFSGGARLLFKPGPPDAAQAAAPFLAWLGRELDGRPLRVAPSLARANHTWIALPEPGATLDEAGRGDASFRCGALLAGLHAAGATGLGWDQIVLAAGEPWLVDADTLAANASAEAPIAGLAEAFLSGSVLRLGLLTPDGEATLASPDLGALGQGTQAHDWRPVLLGAGTDEARWTEAPSTRLPGERPEARAWIEPNAALAGFRAAWDLLRQAGPRLAQDDGLLAPVASVYARHALRRPALYRRLLDAAEHPDHLSDVARREQALAAVARAPSLSPMPETLLAHERRVLVRGAAPRLRVRADARALEGDGGEVWPDYFPRAGWEQVRERMASMDEARERLECQALAASLAPPPDWLAVDAVEAAADAEDDEALRRELRDAAFDLGQRLIDSAVREGERADWFGLQQDDWGACWLRPAGPDLYHGLAGIAVFLGQLGALSGQSSWFDWSRRAMASAQPALHDADYWTGGAFSGRASVVHGLAHAAALQGDRALLTDVCRAARTLADVSHHERLVDIVGGAAGAAAVLLLLGELARDEGLVEDARACARSALTRRAKAAVGCCWPGDLGPRGLTGFAHGNAGLAWSLARVGDALGDPELGLAAGEALAFERALFDPERGNWLDLRPQQAGTDPRPVALGWCHGAPGIGLSRATWPEARYGPEEERDLRLAVAAIRAAPPASNDSLCHGELGRLETLLLAGGRLGDGGLVREARRRGVGLARAAARRGRWRCAVAAQADTPGALVGLAGIGHGLLRLAEPARVASLLAVQAPSQP